MAIPDFDQPDPRAVSLMTQYFADASQRLRAIVLNPPGRGQKSQQFAQARAATQIRQVDSILEQLKNRTATWTGKETESAFTKGLKTAELQYAQLATRNPQLATQQSVRFSDFSVIDQRTVEIFARDTAATLYSSVDSMGQTAKRLLRQTSQLALSESDINQILAGGVIEGQPQATIKALREQFRAVADDGWIEINGRSYKADAYARMVALTRTREATVIARHERLESLGMDLVRIVGRVSDNFCTAYLGQVFSLSGRHPRYPAISELQSGGPPFHPNCSKSTAPYVEELATETQQDVAQGLPDAQKLRGMSTSAAQKAYKDLQLRAQVEPHYGRVTPLKRRAS
jgi:hypothetical protein